VAWFIISLAYKWQIFGDLTAMGAVGLGFTVPDGILPAFVIWGIAKLFGL
jgi:PTS system ascorbate-specific IIC component